MYRIIGADQREYGPVRPDQVREWIAAHRADRDTKIRAEGTIEWKRLEELPEFAEALRQAVMPPSVTPPGGIAPVSPAQEAKTSGLAIASLVLGILGVLTCGITALVGLILGIIALLKINKSGGAQKGQGMAIAGIAVSAAFLLFLPIMAGMLLPALAKAKSKAQSITCMNNLKQLALGALMYSTDQNDTLPAADNWCEALQQYTTSDAPFRCVAGAPEHRCHYGYNARVAGLEMTEIKKPAETVLFFEVEGGWNVSGGREVTLARPRHANVVGVAFCDGHCEMVSPARLNQLQWEPQ